MRNTAHKMFSRSWLAATVLLLGLTVTASPTAMAGERVLNEYQVQAAYILNFIRFTTWPQSAFRDTQQDIIMGMLGQDFFGPVLDDIDGEYIKKRRLQILRFGPGGDPQGCHLIYISSSERRHLQPILASLKGTATLTISDMDNFAAAGGMIQIKKFNDKIKLIINVKETKAAKLHLRANLLKISTLVNQ